MSVGTRTKTKAIYNSLVSSCKKIIVLTHDTVTSFQLDTSSRRTVGARGSSVVERALVVRWDVRSLPRGGIVELFLVLTVSMHICQVDPQLFPDKRPIPLVKVIKYLGVIIDRKLY